MSNKITCADCGGDGFQRCSNPDHGFIDAMGGEIGRLGCPVCGHDHKYRIKTKDGFEKCESCNGIGTLDVSAFEDMDDDWIHDVDMGAR